MAYQSINPNDGAIAESFDEMSDGRLAGIVSIVPAHADAKTPRADAATPHAARRVE